METTPANVWKLLLSACLALSCGCTSDDDSAKPKCEKLVRTYCARVTECAERDELIDPSDAADLTRDCIALVTRESLDCSEADEVSDDYGACLSESAALDCAESNAALLAEDLPPPPAVCQGTVLFAE
jgi:hypothetical protein